MDLVTLDREKGLEDWIAALVQRRKGVRALVAAFNQQVVEAAGPVKTWGLKRVVSALNKLLGGWYRAEAEAIAQIAGLPLADVLLANVAYDLAQAAPGCTTLVGRGERGPLHFRNLDWTFPGTLLRRTATLVHVQNAPAGDFFALGWPGQFGILTGMAPGRFSVTINYVRHARDSGPAAVARHAIAGFSPVTWVVREVFEAAEDFDEAVRMLESAPLVAPVIFTVAGVKDGEAVVIERTARKAALRRPVGGLLVATNHYLSATFAPDGRDITGHDSEARYASARRLGAGVRQGPQALRVLADGELERGWTQYQCAMEPRSGRLWAKVPSARAQTVGAE